MHYEILDVANQQDMVSTNNFNVAVLLSQYACDRGHIVSLLAFREEQAEYPMIGWIIRDGKITALLTERDFQNLSE